MNKQFNIPTTEMFQLASPYGEALFQLFKQGWSNIHAYNIIKKAFPWYTSKQWSFLYNVGKYFYYRWRGWIPVQPGESLEPETIPTDTPPPSARPFGARYRAGVKIFFTNVDLPGGPGGEPLTSIPGSVPKLPPDAEQFTKSLYVNLNDPLSVEEIYAQTKLIVNSILIQSPTFDSYGIAVTPQYYGIEIQSIVKRW